ncbi:hypothetical protein SAMCCGM7_pC0041 (plasmid) [Sinorhizobium americanum CCGM7]|nr:hypothetical protein SAMCCGM7_pC0041 [Sinorhizobium americanum CCGM7]
MRSGVSIVECSHCFNLQRRHLAVRQPSNGSPHSLRLDQSKSIDPGQRTELIGGQCGRICGISPDGADCARRKRFNSRS